MRRSSTSFRWAWCRPPATAESWMRVRPGCRGKSSSRPRLPVNGIEFFAIPFFQSLSFLSPMRSEYCGQVSRKHLGQTVTLYGWVHRRRDHGGVIFVDLRDREGLVQIVCDPDNPATFQVADTLRNEFVVMATGRVRERP